MKLTHAVATVASLLLVASGCAAEDSRRETSDGPGEPGSRTRIHGLQKQMRVDELASHADLVVRGRVSAESVESFPDLAGVQAGTFVVSDVQVGDVLLGPDVGQVEVAHSPTISDAGEGTSLTLSGDDHHGLQVGTEYVLFLFQGDEVWRDRFLVLGEQGTGVVTGGLVELGSGETMGLAELEAALSG